MSDMATIRATAARLKAEGMPVAEYSIRQWVKTGEVPSVKCGQKSLLYYPNVLDYLKSGEQVSTSHPTQVGGIRKVCG
jgi:hypothetical protein